MNKYLVILKSGGLIFQDSETSVRLRDSNGDKIEGFNHFDFQYLESNGLISQGKPNGFGSLVYRIKD